ncbi:hypothetical protein GO495_05475 [Chitinophaga oryziterrae]|uniref:Uncharacterized protein n=1 Tax=Chitinophaga oryziterrae TaxID=1031224 RepID=A0A6N8J4Q9_9BACT|nr:hypothetical protein [Chitinophaga oryziterrae]MVT40023.1 hypothetical protein [Chitinophaga oryziterrae]
MSKSNLIIPDFTEDIVGFMIQSILTITRFPRAPFALVPLSKKDEVIYGADALIDSISPIYIQFKRSFAYPDNSTSSIIKDRKKLRVNCSPRTLFFELRDKQPKHTDYQHNVLFNLKAKLDATGKGKAFYTAPLFLNRTAYLLAVHMSSLLSWRPWHWFMHDPFYEQTQNILDSTGNMRFQNIPILKEHIVIPPHTIVTTHKHKYSYLETGGEICFHDPTYLNNQSTLGQTIYDFLRFRDGQPTTEMMNLTESTSLLDSLQNGQLGGTTDRQRSIIDRWLDFGEMLRIDFDIYQFMLLKLKNE